MSQRKTHQQTKNAVPLPSLFPGSNYTLRNKRRRKTKLKALKIQDIIELLLLGKYCFKSVNSKVRSECHLKVMKCNGSNPILLLSLRKSFNHLCDHRGRLIQHSGVFKRCSTQFTVEPFLTMATRAPPTCVGCKGSISSHLEPAGTGGWRVTNGVRPQKETYGEDA